MNPPFRRTDLTPGRILWVDFGSTVGREQAGLRPAVVVSSRKYASKIGELVIVVPLTRTNRGWSNHVPVIVDSSRPSSESWALTEQVKSISTKRIGRVLGFVDSETLAQIHHWVKQCLGYVPKV